jgi:hypothetical protein
VETFNNFPWKYCKICKKKSQKDLRSILWHMITNISVSDNHSLANISVLHQSIWSDELYQKQCSSQLCRMQIEEVGEVWEDTTSDSPALGNEPLWSSLFFVWAKNRRQATLPKFSGENSPFSENEFARLYPFLRSESPQLCLLATFVMLLEKCIASWANYDWISVQGPIRQFRNT